MLTFSNIDHQRILKTLLIIFYITLLPNIIWAKQTIVVQPAGKASWKHLVQAEIDRQFIPAVTEPIVVPFMPGPGPREIGGYSEGPQDSDSYITPFEKGLTPLGPSLNIAFQALPDDNKAIPPDTHGAAGPNHLMTMLNTQVLIQGKNGLTVSGPISLTSFWTFGTGLSGDPFDPRIVYDSIHSRWIATCDANSRNASSQVFFAISDTSEPTGTWTYYSLDADPADISWADFPGFGVNNTWIAITNNMFTVSANNWAGTKMWVIDKASALAGGALTVTIFSPGFDVDPTYNTDGFAMQPCVTFGSESKLYIVDNSGWSDSGVYLMRISEITGTGSSPSWSVTSGSTALPGTGLFNVSNDFDFGQIGASQLGRKTLVDSGDPRISGNSYFRDNAIWCAHSGGSPVGSVDRTNVYWYQLSPAQMVSTGEPIIQSGVIDGGVDVHHFYPSITANKNNDACLGFSRSNSSIYVQAVYTSRYGTDPLGAMDAVTVLKEGEDTYIKDFGSHSVRWGDYSATVVDPVDDETFWTIQEYAAFDVGPKSDDDRWGTWWGATGATQDADLGIEKTCHELAPGGENPQLAYTIMITNNGPGAATGIVLSDTIPATDPPGALTNPEYRLNGSGFWEDWDGDEELTDLADQDFHMIEIRVDVDDILNFVDNNTASVTSSTTDPDSEKNNSTCSSSISPSVITMVASEVTTDSVTLNGSLDGLGTATSVDVSFEWGFDTGYGNETTSQSMNSTGSFSSVVTGLSHSSTYHFRTKAVGDGTAYGDDSIFTTIIIYDLDGDGDVDIVDIMMVAARWNTSSGDPGYGAVYDLDHDGDIDILDIMKVAAQWGWVQ